MLLEITGRSPAAPERLRNILYSKTKRRPHSGSDEAVAPCAVPTSTHRSFSSPPSPSHPTPTPPVLDLPLAVPSPAPPSDFSTIFLLIFLRYKDQTWPDGASKELEGTTNDLELCLRTFNYRHSQHSHFKIISDIDLTFKDCEGNERQIEGEEPTRENIKGVIMSISSELNPKDNYLIWYGGHASKSPDEGNPENGSLLSLDGESIYGWELRDWLINGVNHRTPITLVLDACHSENLLGLPISYDETNGSIAIRGESSTRKDTNLTLIAAAGRDQYASSASGMNPSNIKPYGVLTWVLLAIMSSPSHGGTMDCIRRLHMKVSEYSHKYSNQLQNPHVTTSLQPLHGELAIFNIPGLAIVSDVSAIGGRWSVLRLMLIRLWSSAVSLINRPRQVPGRAAFPYLWHLLQRIMAIACTRRPEHT